MRKELWGRPGHRVLSWSPHHLVFSVFSGVERDSRTPRLPLPSSLRLDQACLGCRDPEETASALGGWRGREFIHGRNLSSARGKETCRGRLEVPPGSGHPDCLKEPVRMALGALPSLS